MLALNGSVSKMFGNKQVTLTRVGQHTYHLSDGWQRDYPLRYWHNGQIVYDRPESWSKEIRSWVENKINS